MTPSSRSSPFCGGEQRECIRFHAEHCFRGPCWDPSHAPLFPSLVPPHKDSVYLIWHISLKENIKRNKIKVASILQKGQAGKPRKGAVGSLRQGPPGLACPGLVHPYQQPRYEQEAGSDLGDPGHGADARPRLAVEGGFPQHPPCAPQVCATGQEPPHVMRPPKSPTVSGQTVFYWGWPVLVLGLHLGVLWAHSWFRRSHVVLGIQARVAVCKATALPTVLSLLDPGCILFGERRAHSTSWGCLEGSGWHCMGSRQGPGWPGDLTSFLVLPPTVSPCSGSLPTSVCF